MRSPARRLVVAAACALGAIAAGPAAASAAVEVAFVQGQQLVMVKRPGDGAAAAVRALVAGPRPAEARRGVRSYLPAGTPVRSVTVSGRVATVDLGARFTRTGTADDLDARLAQLVQTATAVDGVGGVRLLVDGARPSGVFPRVDVSRPLTPRSLRAPVTATRAPAPPAAPPNEYVRAIQQRLADLGFLRPGAADGIDGPVTRAAVIAFQKWNGLAVDGASGPQTIAALSVAVRPTPITTGGAGRRVEVLLDRQIALAIENDRVVRTLHVSTGTEATPTPAGAFRVYAKIPRWWSVPFREWLPKAAPFVAGIAFHGYDDVPAVPASHGCVRLTHPDSAWLYGFLRVGTRVRVIETSKWSPLTQPAT
ncbi:MAG: L,D-transpeptidase family protein [Thermoleophilia bacterium]